MVKIKVEIYGNNIDDAGIKLHGIVKNEFADSSTPPTGGQWGLLHLFGQPTAELLSRAKACQKKEIPVVYTPCGTMLIDGAKWGRYGIITRHHAMLFQKIITSGPEEKKALAKIIPSDIIQTIPSPILSQNTVQAYLAALHSIYDTVDDSYDKQIHEAIARRVNNVIANNIKKSEDISDKHYEDEVKLLKQLLYIRHHLLRDSFPKSLIQSFATTLSSCDIDEPQFLLLTRSISAIKLLRRVLYCLTQMSLSSEGYYPITPLNDRKARDILIKVF